MHNQESYPPTKQYSNLLMIDNFLTAAEGQAAGTNTLIYGDFNKRMLRINGDFEVTGEVQSATTKLVEAGASSNYVTRVYSGGVLTITEVYNGTTNTYTTLNN